MANANDTYVLSEDALNHVREAHALMAKKEAEAKELQVIYTGLQAHIAQLIFQDTGLDMRAVGANIKLDLARGIATVQPSEPVATTSVALITPDATQQTIPVAEAPIVVPVVSDTRESAAPAA